MHVYVVGNVTIDETMIVDALPLIGASILGRAASSDLGGKGANQAVVMARCGIATTLIAPVGNDARAAMIRTHLHGENVTSVLLDIDGEASDMSVIFRLPDGDNAIVTSNGCAQSLRTASVVPHLSKAKPGDLMVLQGNLSEPTTRGLLDHARELGMITVFNPSPLRPYFSGLWRLIDTIFLNQVEARTLTGTTGAAAARHLIAEGVGAVVLTSGGDGARFVDADRSIDVPATSCDVIDTTGAGDTFMAVALASASLTGGGIDRQSLDRASQAAAITVSRPGTVSAFPTASELQAILHRP